MDAIIKSYTRAKTPYFFKYAKNKLDHQVEDINDCMMNKIVKEIKENRCMFNPIKGLAQLDHTVLLPLEYNDYSSDEVNSCFDKWNKKYGNVALKFDEENTNKNNINIIAQEVRKELLDIEPDETKVIISLVNFLYRKPSNRKKKLLWYMYGEQLYNNIMQHEEITTTHVCEGCGVRGLTDLAYSSGLMRCHRCRSKLNKKLGYREIICKDCGKHVRIKVGNKRTCRCESCQNDYKKTSERIRKRKNSAF